jgi:hypothetical protein
MHAQYHRNVGGAKPFASYHGTSCAAASGFLIKLQVKEFADEGRSPASIVLFSSAEGEFCVCKRHLKYLLAASDHRRAWDPCVA